MRKRGVELVCNPNGIGPLKNATITRPFRAHASVTAWVHQESTCPFVPRTRAQCRDTTCEEVHVLIQVAKQPASRGPFLALREREILALMAQRLTNPQIAHEPATGRSVVTFHIRSNLSPLGLPSRTEVVVVAVRQHLTTWTGSHLTSRSGKSLSP